VAVGLVVLAIGWALGGKPGIGTVANAVLVGTFIQILTSADAVTGLAHDSLGVRIPLLLAGIWLIGPATAFYIGADLGAGTRDTRPPSPDARMGARAVASKASSTNDEGDAHVPFATTQA